MIKAVLIFCLLFFIGLNSCKSNANFDSTYNYQKGLEYLNQGNFENAISEFDKEILNNPGNEKAYYNRGIAKSKLNFWEDAINDYNETIKLKPNDYLAYYAKGNALKKLNNLSGAIENYNLAIQLNPNYLKALFNRANTFIDLKEYESAIQDYEKAIFLDSANYEYHYNLGNVYKKINQLDDAIISYKKSIQYNSDFAPSYNNLATTEKRLKNYKEALKYIDEAIKLSPEMDYYNNRGNIYRAMGDCKNAIEDYNSIIEKDSVYSEAYYGRALCENELNMYNEAIDDLTKFIDFKPNDAIALLNRGQVFVNLKDYESACKDFERSFSLGEDSAGELITKYCK